VRSSWLTRCLPIPADAVAVDWFIATRAWLLGARFRFDAGLRMEYRQHDRNTARLRPPFTAVRVREDTALVRRHFRLVQDAGVESASDQRVAALREVAADVERFHERIVLEPGALDAYVRQLNALCLPTVWWASVAFPELRRMWR
jgi:hypothetical protein